MSELLNEVTEAHVEYETTESVQHTGVVVAMAKPRVQTHVVNDAPLVLSTFRAQLDGGEQVTIPVWEPELDGFKEAVLGKQAITVVENKRREVQIMPNGFRQPIRVVAPNWRYLAALSPNLENCFDD